MASEPPPADVPEPRRGQAQWPMPRAAFAARFRHRFADPAFAPQAAAIDDLLEIAWDAYCASRKAPRTRAAGAGFADPGFELSEDWLQAHAAVEAAQARHDDPAAPSRVLVVCASPRNDATCPGEASKTWRLMQAAVATLDTEGSEADPLDLSVLASDYQRVIHPCKACVSTAMPLCHWPCSCYPNHALGQVNDWMAELYPRWVAAHGVLLLTPVHWFQVPSPLKLMMDRLVCADGGNPDPTRTRGKDPRAAKALERAGWDYPRHLAGRSFGVVAHGDAEGVGQVARAGPDSLPARQLARGRRGAVGWRSLLYYRRYP